MRDRAAGRGEVLGAPLGDLEARRRIGYLPELFRYQPWLRAREVLVLHCELAGLLRADRRAAVDGSLALVGLTERADDLVGTFSKGMQQRLGLGVALLGSPDIVFLDEPTSALDPVGRSDVRDIIRSARERGATVFLNSHLLTEVERVCDRVAIVDRGGSSRAAPLTRSVATPRFASEPPPCRQMPSRRSMSATGSSSRTMPCDFRIPAAEQIPDVVAAIVAAGGRIHAVDPGRTTLEEAFLELLRHGDS